MGAEGDGAGGVGRGMWMKERGVNLHKTFIHQQFADRTESFTAKLYIFRYLFVINMRKMSVFKIVILVCILIINTDAGFGE